MIRRKRDSGGSSQSEGVELRFVVSLGRILYGFALLPPVVVEFGDVERPGDCPGRPQIQVVWWRAQEPHTGWTSLHWDHVSDGIIRDRGCLMV